MTLKIGKFRFTKSQQYNAAIPYLPYARPLGYAATGFYTAASGGTKISTSTK